MTIDIERLSEFETSVRMWCEAPLCSRGATFRASYTYALDNEEARTYDEVMCTWHALELADEIARAESQRIGSVLRAASSASTIWR